jgi:hypothetical protein
MITEKGCADAYNELLAECELLQEANQKIREALNNAMIYANYCDEFHDTSKNGAYLDKAREVWYEINPGVTRYEKS